MHTCKKEKMQVVCGSFAGALRELLFLPIEGCRCFAGALRVLCERFPEWLQMALQGPIGRKTDDLRYLF